MARLCNPRHRVLKRLTILKPVAKLIINGAQQTIGITNTAILHGTKALRFGHKPMDGIMGIPGGGMEAIPPLMVHGHGHPGTEIGTERKIIVKMETSLNGTEEK